MLVPFLPIYAILCTLYLFYWCLFNLYLFYLDPDKPS
jgi:hypothetical protein